MGSDELGMSYMDYGIASQLGCLPQGQVAPAPAHPSREDDLYAHPFEEARDLTSYVNQPRRDLNQDPAR
jgi:hypothetical protein